MATTRGMHCSHKYIKISNSASISMNTQSQRFSFPSLHTYEYMSHEHNCHGDLSCLAPESFKRHARAVQTLTWHADVVRSSRIRRLCASSHCAMRRKGLTTTTRQCIQATSEKKSLLLLAFCRMTESFRRLCHKTHNQLTAFTFLPCFPCLKTHAECSSKCWACSGRSVERYMVHGIMDFVKLMLQVHTDVRTLFVDAWACGI